METYECYKNAKERFREENGELLDEIMNGEDDENLTQWPQFFVPDDEISRV